MICRAPKVPQPLRSSSEAIRFCPLPARHGCPAMASLITKWWCYVWTSGATDPHTSPALWRQGIRNRSTKCCAPGQAESMVRTSSGRDLLSLGCTGRPASRNLVAVDSFGTYGGRLQLKKRKQLCRDFEGRSSIGERRIAEANDAGVLINHETVRVEQQ